MRFVFEAERSRSRDSKKQAIAQMREGLAAYLATGSNMTVMNFLGLLAEAYRRVGQAEQGLGAVAKGLAQVENTEERWYEAELYRLKGELLLAQDQSNAAQAESCFQTAIAAARHQSAKSWELRATTSVSRLLARHGRLDEACTMLVGVYNWFTEGFDTADLKKARALLDELNR
jgi:predicted ATPase